jgi:tRNA threonylcarbamoyladenosine biosynthesis protein TsaB
MSGQGPTYNIGMNLLAFELSTEACSVALWVDGDVRERHEIAPRRHAELALPWAEALLAEAGIAKSKLDAIAVGRGPGAFTGVRLGVAMAQGIALALDRPAVPVSTLAALAMRSLALGAGEGDAVLAAIDARMNEVYVAAYRLTREHDALRPMPTVVEQVLAPDAVPLPDDGGAWFGVGTGFGALGGALASRLPPHWRALDAEALPHAADIVRLAHAALLRGEAVAPEMLEPAYLRNQVALTLVEQQALRAARA